MFMIETENLTKRYGNLTAVDNLNLRVEAGELFGFLGPNGAGKTTTIKLLVGLLRPSAGMARIGGYDVQRDSLKAKSLVGFVPDNPYLYEKLTAREFLRFMADLYGVDPDRAARRGEDLLHLLDLDDRGDELIQGYSHGMRQKTALAGALIHDPKVFFLDEPTVGLDPKSARLIKDILRQLCDRGMTVFMSTHILEIAERMCDRVGIINEGQLVACGTMEELRSGTGEAGGASLEDIFLRLTGGAEYEELSHYLSE
jgi:ABC-2 type transport system ATP-binding protein